MREFFPSFFSITTRARHIITSTSRRLTRVDDERSVSVGELLVHPVDVHAPLVHVRIQQLVRLRLSARRHLHQAVHEVLLVAPPPSQTLLRDSHHLHRDVLHRTVPELRLKPVLRHRLAQVLALLRRPVRHERLRVCQRGLVVEQTDPHRGERANVTPRPAVRAAHLHVPLQAHLGEARREMLLPVVQRGVLAGELRELPAHEIPKRFARDVVVRAVAVDEIHGHVQHVLGVAFEAEVVLEDPLQGPRPVRVGVRPHVRAQGLLPGRFAVAEGRVGKERGGDWLERQARPKLTHHVLLALKV
mmetsp:Transcript_10244/g.41389  ORF Transcript_10244/g.41389 Transcript_10244/m.41389 type:complete len:302 (-) Transcript_10244:574-1479(-)